MPRSITDTTGRNVPIGTSLSCQNRLTHGQSRTTSDKIRRTAAAPNHQTFSVGFVRVVMAVRAIVTARPNSPQTVFAHMRPLSSSTERFRTRCLAPSFTLRVTRLDAELNESASPVKYRRPASSSNRRSKSVGETLRQLRLLLYNRRIVSKCRFNVVRDLLEWTRENSTFSNPAFVKWSPYAKGPLKRVNSNNWKVRNMIDTAANLEEFRMNSAALRRLAQEFLELHYQKFALLRHGNLIAVFNTCHDAHIYAFENFPDGLFSVSHIVIYVLDERGICVGYDNQRSGL